MRQHSLTDIRAIIAMVLGLLGIFLVVCGFAVDGPSEMARTGGINANLWAGIGLAVIGAFMGAWWWIRPQSGGCSDPVLEERRP